MKFLDVFSNTAHALLRVAAGFMFSFHGVQKIFGLWTQHRPTVGTQIWYGGMIEMVAGALVMGGLFTRPAAFLCSGTMAVAYVQFHWKLQGGPAFFPAINGGELAALYSFVFLLIACRGTVKWGLKG